MKESGFYDFMGFDPEYARRVRAFYLPFFSGRTRVLDVACGRGEFLDVLRDNGVGGLGVDLDSGMVARARAAGHEVVEADVFEYLTGRVGEFDGIFSAHFVEHLTSERVERLFELAHRALKPQGVLVVCTPNAASLPTLQRHFWWDATHVRMYDPELLKYMMKAARFEALESGVNPLNLPGQPVGLDGFASAPPPPGSLSRARRRLGGASAERRLEELSRQVGIVARTLEGLIAELYSPSEVYSKGVRP